MIKFSEEESKKNKNSDIVLSNAFNIDDLITRWRRKDRNSDFSFGFWMDFSAFLCGRKDAKLKERKKG